MNKMSNYDPKIEDQRTLETMAKNFDAGYDGDPTPDQSDKFEKSRLKEIEEGYKRSLLNSEIEEKIFLLISKEPEIEGAIQDAKSFHKDQYRKIDNIPFIEHPISVAKILSRITQDIEIIQGALFHDVIEDVDEGREKLSSKYPEAVVKLVDSVTEQDKSLPWKERKVLYINHLKEAGYKTLLLSLSDRIQNLRDMIKYLEKYGNKIREEFNAGPKEQERFILKYSLEIKKSIDKIEIEDKSKILELYNELCSLIGYFLELLPNKSQSQ